MIAAPSRTFVAVKRTIDILIALSLVPGLALCAVILIVLNPIKNPGPMIFRQDRVGRLETRFKIYKFRTMEVGADGSVARFATEEEARISKLGAFMRRTRIDELPQIINVLKGDMSMIGPRPEQVTFYEDYSRCIPGYSDRQAIKPGITGLAQLKYGYTCDKIGTARKLKWDLEYIARMGYRLELYIIWKTFLFVMGRLLRIRTTSKL